MGRILYIADWHYNHANCVHFDNRPFKSIEQMNLALVENWNKVVNDDDKVYVLGDMFWNHPVQSIEVLKTLHGEKFLIKGNHDNIKSDKFREQFIGIKEYLEIVDGSRNVVLCHYPIPYFRNHYYGWYHLYAHVHQSFEYNMVKHQRFLMEELYTKPCEMYNVGAMMPWMNYTPRTLDEILIGAQPYWKKYKSEHSEPNE